MFQQTKRSITLDTSWVIPVAALVAAIIFALGIFFGRAFLPPQTVQLEDGQVLGREEIDRLTSDVDFNLFWDVWDMLQESYIYGPVAEKDLFYAALDGLVEGVGDPYTSFFDPKESAEFQTDLSGQFEGIGAEIGLRDGQIVVVSPLKDAPAQRAGVKAGDAIHLIDETETYGMTIEEAVREIRGPKGTTVTLTVTRGDSTKPMEIAIRRDVIEIASVEWELREDGIAVINLFAFNEDTARAFNDVVVSVLANDVKGIVLDMRNNPGGFLDRAVTIAGEWVGNKTVVIERMEDGLLRPLDAQGVARLKDIPTVVLVNEGSASATEIVAGALQDYGAATIMGEQTFGKGSVQEYRELSDGSALKITIAEWLTPQGRSIQKEGIKPDELVTFSDEDVAKGVDTQFQRAIAFLATL